MPDSPLLTPEALKAAQDAVARSGLFYADSAPTAQTVARAFLAGQDSEALAREFAEQTGHTHAEQIVAQRFARWLGLGGDDA